MKLTFRRKQIIHPSDLPKGERVNINGPCCIKVPKWCKSKLANYYLYYAHHSGENIRMSYTNNLFEKWSSFKGGVLNINQTIDAYGHIASPEIMINEQEELIYMYFHAPSKSKNGEQWTYLAVSIDGINFKQISKRPIAPFYLRIFNYRGYTYGMVKGGSIWKFKKNINSFNFLTNPFNNSDKNEIWHNYEGAVRHVGLFLKKDILHVFYSKISDIPERIMHTFIKVNKKNDKKWVVEKCVEIIRPEKIFEGSNLPLKKSTAGAAHYPENALRDPFIFFDSNKYYLFYSIAGEQGIAISEFDNLPK